LPYFSPRHPDNQINNPSSSASTNLTTTSQDIPSHTSTATIHHHSGDDTSSSSDGSRGDNEGVESSAAAPPSPAGLPFVHGTSSGSATGSGFGPVHPNSPLRLSANEVLIGDGMQVLLHIMQYHAKEWPIEGLHEFKDYLEVRLLKCVCMCAHVGTSVWILVEYFDQV
jgi:hypothetical protein